MIGVLLFGVLVGIAIATTFGGSVTERYEAGAELYLPQPESTAEGASLAADADEGPCRAYSKEVTIGGRTETIHGTACRQPDGSWNLSGSGVP